MWTWSGLDCTDWGGDFHVMLLSRDIHSIWSEPENCSNPIPLAQCFPNCGLWSTGGSCPNVWCCSAKCSWEPPQAASVSRLAHELLYWPLQALESLTEMIGSNLQFVPMTLGLFLWLPVSFWKAFWGLGVRPGTIWKQPVGTRSSALAEPQALCCNSAWRTR